MREVNQPEKLQSLLKRLKRRDKSVGFVPTMGALHEGHLSLVRAARRENDCVVVSIFVNPTQFGPNEDFARYPRPLSQDRALLRKEKIDYLFLPSVKAMYGPNDVTRVSLPASPLAERLCGRFRPGHFQGVATIVTKLFNIVRPDRAYFGAKDYQQSLIVQRLVTDLKFDVKIRVLPTVREKDGLAMSSRNAYLRTEERRRALALSRALFVIRDRLKAGEKNLARLRQNAYRHLARYADRIDYLEIVHPETLLPLRRPLPKMVALGACWVGRTRLIDNVIIWL